MGYYAGVARCGLDILNFGITWRRVYQSGEIRESSIDQLLVNKPASIIKHFPIDISYSDHKAICADVHVNVQKQVTVTVKSRDLRKIRKSPMSFQEALQQVNWH